MDVIKIKNFTIKLEVNLIQISPQGRPFRLSGTELVLNEPAIFYKKEFIHKVIHSFRYVDKEDGFFKIKCDYYGNFICKL